MVPLRRVLVIHESSVSHAMISLQLPASILQLVTCHALASFMADSFNCLMSCYCDPVTISRCQRQFGSNQEEDWLLDNIASTAESALQPGLVFVSKYPRLHKVKVRMHPHVFSSISYF